MRVAMEKNPTTIGKEASAQYVLQLIRKKELMHLPVVDDQGKVIEIANLSEDRFVLEQTGFKITR